MNCIGGVIVVIGVNGDVFATAAAAAAAAADCRTQMVFSFCHTNTLWTIAAPQNTIPTPIRTLVTMAGVDWNCVNV